jgi:uncharacterized membrane protein
LLGVDVLLFVLTLSNVGGPWRFALGLAFAVTTPGWSLVGLLNLKDSALETGLSVAVSLALLMVCAQAMMALRIWHPVALEELACLICAPSLILQSKELRRVVGRSR